MPKKTLYIVAAVFLVLIIAGTILRIVKPNLLKPAVNKQTSSNVPKIDKTKSPVFVLPVAYNNPAVKAASVRYTLQGTINSIKGTAPNLELDTTINNIPGGPKFILTKDTKIERLINKSKTPASFDDLKPGQIVNFNTEYKLREKYWTIFGVVILSDGKPETTFIPSSAPLKR